MKPHAVEVRWGREGSDFLDRTYSRAHAWRFDGGAEVAASSSPEVVRAPMSDPSAVDPEEAFVASLASCHMLWFLDLAAREGFVVDAYVDHAEGHMAKNENGKMWMARVVLAPEISFSGAKLPSAAELDALHHRAHEECFLANSVRTEIVVRSGHAPNAT